MKKLIASAVAAALAVGLTTVPAHATSVEVGNGNCVIEMENDDVGQSAYRLTGVYAEH